MHVGILLFKDCSMWSAMGTMELLTRANRVQKIYFSSREHKPEFDVEFVSVSKNEIETTYPMPIPVLTASKTKKFDLIIVPGFDIGDGLITKEIIEAADWVGEKYKAGATIASVCTGAVILAQAGILEGKTATTHWLIKNNFEKLYPNVNMCSNKILIDHGNILMCGGATSFQNLALHLIEKYMGKSLALRISKFYLIDMHKTNQDAYMNLAIFKQHNDIAIKRAQKYIEKNFKKRIALDELALISKLNLRTFIRRFKKATDETPLKYIQKVKVEKAKELLELCGKSFEEIAFEIGYEDVNAFRKIFVAFTGELPTKYRGRYQVVQSN